MLIILHQKKMVNILQVKNQIHNNFIKIKNINKDIIKHQMVQIMMAKMDKYLIKEVSQIKEVIPLEILILNLINKWKINNAIHILKMLCQKVLMMITIICHKNQLHQHLMVNKQKIFVVNKLIRNNLIIKEMLNQI